MPPKEWPTTASTGPCAAATARRQRITCGMLVVLPGLSPCAGASKARQLRPAPVSARIMPPRWVARDPQPWTSSTGALHIRARAAEDGYWRWHFAGSATTGAAKATGDYVDVRP